MSRARTRPPTSPADGHWLGASGEVGAVMLLAGLATLAWHAVTRDLGTPGVGAFVVTAGPGVLMLAITPGRRLVAAVRRSARDSATTPRARTK